MLTLLCIGCLCQGNSQGDDQQAATNLCDVCTPDLNSSDASFRLINGFVTGGTTPKVIDVSIDESFSIHFETDFDNVDSIRLSTSFFNNFSMNGSGISSLLLFDDGNGNDVTAGDMIFTSAGITYNSASFIDYVSGGFMRFVDVTYYFSNGTSQMYNIDLGFGIRFINGANVGLTPEVYFLSNSAQYASHVVNFSIDNLGVNPFSSLSTHTNAYYSFFPDDRDFIMFATTYPTPNGPAASYSAVKREETGTVYNGSTFDNSAFYGSTSGELNGLIRYYYVYGGALNLTVHEMLHHWASFLNPSLHLSTGAHWSVIEASSSGFGSGWQCTNIIDLGNNCYDTERVGFTNHYNGLEQYLMGLEPLSYVSWPIDALADWTFNGWSSPCPISSTTGIVSISQTDYESAMPPRVPDHINSQKDFSSALIVLSDGLLSQKEMAYYNFQMIQNELLINDPMRVVWGGLNFNEASYGKATLTTVLPCPDQISVNINPIESNTYQAYNISSNGFIPNGNSVLFNAGAAISLEDDFEIAPGAVFEAKIIGCQ